MVIDFIIYKYTSFGTWFPLFIFFLSIDIATALHILRNKHNDAASALLWFFVIANFHLIGVFFYFMLGINRLKTTGVKIGKANIDMNMERKKVNVFLKYLKTVASFNYTSYSVGSYLSVFDKILPETTPLSGNSIELLEDGTAAYPKMIDAIIKARSHIHLQSFIIVNDELGNKMFSLLEQKAKEGVKVKVLFDRLGSSKAYSSHFFKQWIIKNTNFEIKAFSTYNLLAPYRIQLRNHRKLLICDGELAFVGGINISNENVFKLNSKYIHDLHCEISGPVVGEFQYIFLRDWSFVAKIPPEVLMSEPEYFPELRKKGGAVIRAIASGPGQSESATEKIFMTAASVAKKSLWIITPYFVPDKPFLSSLCMTASRGIDVRVIIPQNNNHWYVRYASRSLYNTLLENNIRIFEKQGNFSHSKAVIVDNTWAFMGSSNCDVRSFKLNYELDFTIQDESFIEVLYQKFMSEISQSVEITQSDRLKRSYREEMIEDLCSLFTPML